MLKITDLQKTYPDGKQALRGISLHVKKGEFIALLGPNGAGKTTLINALIGHVKPTSGTVEVAGMPATEHPLTTKRLLGVVPQDVSLDGFFTTNEVMRHQMGYFGLKPNQAHIDELLTDLGLIDKKDTVTRGLSGGMKRRLLIAKALVHKPQLFILDEPTAGVDIELRRGLYTYLERLHERGVTMILTTHYLEEAERLCDRIVVIHEGQVIADAPKKDLMAQLGHVIEVQFRGVQTVPAALQSQVKPSTKQLHCAMVEKVNLGAFLTQVDAEGLQYSDFEVKQPNLEDVFLKLVHQK